MILVDKQNIENFEAGKWIQGLDKLDKEVVPRIMDLNIKKGCGLVAPNYTHTSVIS